MRILEAPNTSSGPRPEFMDVRTPVPPFLRTFIQNYANHWPRRSGCRTARMQSVMITPVYANASLYLVPPTGSVHFSEVQSMIRNQLT